MKEIYRYFKIDQRAIAFLQYTIEAYEDLAIVRTVNPKEGIVELIIAPDFTKQMDEVLSGLSKEMEMEEVRIDIPPSTWDSLKDDSGDIPLNGRET